MKNIFQKYVKLEIRSAKGKNEPLLSNISSCSCGYNPLVPFLCFCEAHDAFEIACEDGQCCLHRHVFQSVGICAVKSAVMFKVGVLCLNLVSLSHLVLGFLRILELNVLYVTIGQQSLDVCFHPSSIVASIS